MSQRKPRFRSDNLASSLRRWGIPESLDPELVIRVSNDTGVIPEVASILLRRFGADPVKAVSFILNASQESGFPVSHENGFHASHDGGLPALRGSGLPDVLFLPGMRQAVDRLARARASGERVIVYSDFDCDGVTSAAVLSEGLEQAGFENFDVYFPNRMTEGYGFHAGSATALAREGASLFVTSDCGISGQEACSALKAIGIDVIITDHHLPGEVLPGAVSVLDPHMPEWEGCDLTGLSGAGMAYLLVLALHRHLEITTPVSWAHDLLTLSIAGDGQPVTGLNRAWIRSGLSSMSGSPRQGVFALLKVARITLPRALSFDRDIMYGLVPRINAAGRLSDPRLAYELLCTSDPLRAADLAAELDSLNKQRKEIEDRILEECWEDLSLDAGAMCAYRPAWHEGVIGIACSRIRESTGRPVALAGGDGDRLKGSVRGVSGFNVVAALKHCGDMLTAYGGHAGAGGFSVEKDKVEAFFRAFDAVTREMLEDAGLTPPVRVDEVMPVDRIAGDSLRRLLELEPFGDGNPMPQVACMDCSIQHVGLMGSTLDHLQITLAKSGVSQRFLWFSQGKRARDIALMGTADVLFTPYKSVFKGSEQFSPLVREMRAAWSGCGTGYDGVLSEALQGGPVIIYTWSEDAARSMAIACLRAGKDVELHLAGQTGAGAREARAVLRAGGVVVSTAPWEIVAPEGFSLTVMHAPISSEDEANLEEFLRKVAGRVSNVPLNKDAENWLSWAYPDKDRLRTLWKFLFANYGARVLLTDLGSRWDEVLRNAGYGDEECCPDGGRLFLKSGIIVFEQVGLVTYDTSRRTPELVLRRQGDKVNLEDSAAFLAGEEVRRLANGRRNEVEGFH